MKKAKVFRNGDFVGILTKEAPKGYSFSYDHNWYEHPDKPAISLTLPKTQKEHRADHLFPFFFNMLSEGANLQLQARQFQVDASDYFGLLLLTAQNETIGPITVEPIA